MKNAKDNKEGLNPKIREVAERLEWDVVEYDDGMVDFRKYSPAGEDFGFAVNAKWAIRPLNEQKGIRYENYQNHQRTGSHH